MKAWAERMEKQVRSERDRVRYFHDDSKESVAELVAKQRKLQADLDAFCAQPAQNLLAKSDDEIDAMTDAPSEFQADQRHLLGQWSTTSLEFPVMRIVGLHRSLDNATLLPRDGPHRAWLQARLKPLDKTLVRCGSNGDVHSRCRRDAHRARVTCRLMRVPIRIARCCCTRHRATVGRRTTSSGAARTSAERSRL